METEQVEITRLFGQLHRLKHYKIDTIAIFLNTETLVLYDFLRNQEKIFVKSLIQTKASPDALKQRRREGAKRQPETKRQHGQEGGIVGGGSDHPQGLGLVQAARPVTDHMFTDSQSLHADLKA